MPSCNAKYLSDNRNIRILFLSLVLCLSFQLLRGQKEDYRQIFGDNWTKAEQYEGSVRVWMKPLFEKHHFSYEMAMAVVFPELVRYSVLRDKMEVSVLKALYINLGHDYANFSVGLFQMKPSFAEVIRSMPRDLKGRNTGVKLADSSEFRNIKDFRREIVNDLEDPRKEAGYLIAFLRVCDRRFNISRDTITAIRFLATAYNTGFTKESAEIDKVSDLKFFNTKLFGGTMYSYADVSLFWYKTCSSALKN